MSKIIILLKMFHFIGFWSTVKIVLNRLVFKNAILKISIKGIKHPVFIRSNSSDFNVLIQVFCEREYDFPMHGEINAIADAGANIGLATLFFKCKFPNAKICCIEPEVKNFELLKKNTEKFEDIYCYQAALWCNKTRLDIKSHIAGAWAFSVVENPDNGVIEALTIPDLEEKVHVRKFDIVKVDIEGSEFELFESQTEWADTVGNLIVETHDRMKPGSSHPILRLALKNKLNLAVQGELLHFSRFNGAQKI